MNRNNFIKAATSSTAALFCYLLCTATAAGGPLLIPKEVLGTFQFYPRVNVTDNQLTLSGFTSIDGLLGVNGVILGNGTEWLDISAATTGWNLSSTHYINAISRTENGSILAGANLMSGSGMLAMFDKAESVWSQQPVAEGSIERDFRFISPISGNRALFSMASVDITNRETINHIPTRVGKMFAEVFLWQNGTLRKLGQSDPASHRVEFGQFVEGPDGAFYAGFFRSLADDKQSLVRATPGGVEFLSLEVPTPLGAVPLSVRFDDGSLGFVYPGRAAGGQILRWHPERGIIANTVSPADMPYNLIAITAMGGTIIGVNGGDRIWNYDGVHSTSVSLSKLLGQADGFIQQTFDIQSANGKLYITTDRGLCIVESVALVTSVEEPGLVSSAGQVYPNPSRGSAITIDTPEGVFDSVRILSSDGRDMEVETTFSANHIRIETASMPSGTYFVLLTSNNQRLLRPFVVLR
jgi:hypothetical protein